MRDEQRTDSRREKRPRTRVSLLDMLQGMTAVLAMDEREDSAADWDCGLCVGLGEGEKARNAIFPQRRIRNAA
jgi:hypothetical protein